MSRRRLLGTFGLALLASIAAALLTGDELAGFLVAIVVWLIAVAEMAREGADG